MEMEKKPAAALVALIASRRKGKPEAPKGDDGPVTPAAEVAAFKQVRQALASEDDAKGAAALKKFLAACGVYDE
jgi:hypothetical protein